MYRFNSYSRASFEFSYLLTKGGLEIDLVLTEPRGKHIFIEVKSTKQVRDHHLKSLKSVMSDFPKERYICICQEETARLVDGIEIIPWTDIFKELGFSLDV